MPRILSTHGNVIAADFRPRDTFRLSASLRTETLFCDGQVMLVRTAVRLGDEPEAVSHFLADMATCRIVQL